MNTRGRSAMSGICGCDCNRCNLKIYCQGCSLCDAAYCEKDCHRCFSICPEKGASFAHLNEIRVGQIELCENDKYDLPCLIPVLPDRLTEKLFLPQNIIGIHGENFLSSNGENVAKVYRTKGLKDAINLANDDIQGVLQFYVKDRTLEGFWDNRKEIYRQMREFPFKAVIAPNFSVYEDAPRMDHLYNMRRSSIVYNELIEEGFPAVPDISWFSKADLDRWIKEINENNVKTVAFSFQSVGTGSRASNAYVDNLIGFKYLTSHISKHVDIIIAGMISVNRIEIIKANCENRFSVLNQSAYVYSRRGILSETGKSANFSLTKNQILLRNLEFYEKNYER